MREPAPDFVTSVLRIWQEERAREPVDAVLRTEMRIRQEWGGKRPYIAKKGCGDIRRGRRQPLP
jgi:hypothetical protein